MGTRLQGSRGGAQRGMPAHPAAVRGMGGLKVWAKWPGNRVGGPRTRPRICITAYPLAKETTVLDLKVGDVVRLRAGGPTMTVTAWDQISFPLGAGPGWSCAWHVQAALRRGTFPPDALELVAEAAPSA